MKDGLQAVQDPLGYKLFRHYYVDIENRGTIINKKIKFGKI